MAISPALSNTLLVITAAVLVYAAFTDIREFKIRNEMIVVLAALFLAHAALSGRWTSLHWNLAFAAFMFCVMLIFYARNWMGGGDVKILTVGFLWVGLDCALPFALLLLGFIVIHVVAAKLGWVRIKQRNGRDAIPFAPAVAGALIVSFLLGCLHPKEYLIDISQQFEPAICGTQAA